MNRNTLIVLALLLMTIAGISPAAAEGPTYEELRDGFWQALADGESITDEDRLNMAKVELLNLQLQSERFSVDHSVGERAWQLRYPEDAMLLTAGKCCEEHDFGDPYMQPGFYPNPYSASAESELDAQPVPFGWTPEAVGNFSYLPQRYKDGNITGYVLLLWGPDRYGGLDVTGDGQPDGVAYLLVSGGEALFDRDGNWVDLWSGNHDEAWLPVTEHGRPLMIHWQAARD